MLSARLWFLVVWSCVSFGCAAGTLRPQYPIQDASVALQRREATIEGLHRIRAEARVDQRAKSGRIKGTVLMFVEDTGRVRFDVMTQFGPIAILTSDGEKFAYSDLREKRYLFGPTCPENISRLLGVPLSAEETARFLLGGTPLIAHTDSKLVLNDAGHYQLTLAGQSGAKQELELAVYPGDEALAADKQRLQLVRSELWDAEKKSVWRVSYSDHEAIQLEGRQLQVPKRVHIEQPSHNADTLVSFKSIAANPNIPAEAFTQTARPGMQEEEAPCDEVEQTDAVEQPDPAAVPVPEPAASQPTATQPTATQP